MKRGCDKIGFLCLAAALLCAAQTAQAAELSTISSTTALEGNRVTIVSQVTQAKEGQELSILVLRRDADPASPADGDVIYLNQLPVMDGQVQAQVVLPTQDLKQYLLVQDGTMDTERYVKLLDGSAVPAGGTGGSGSDNDDSDDSGSDYDYEDVSENRSNDGKNPQTGGEEWGVPAAQSDAPLDTPNETGAALEPAGTVGGVPNPYGKTEPEDAPAQFPGTQPSEGEAVLPWVWTLACLAGAGLVGTATWYVFHRAGDRGGDKR